jgi:hypothetical protein
MERNMEMQDATQTVAALVAECKRQALPQARTRIASLLAYRLSPLLIAAVEDERYDAARSLIAAYWAYIGEPENVRQALEAPDRELRSMARGYRTRLSKRDGMPLCLVARATAYRRWLGRLRSTLQRDLQPA